MLSRSGARSFLALSANKFENEEITFYSATLKCKNFKHQVARSVITLPFQAN